MSGAAIAYVEALALKGSARDLLHIIAKQIPEGQTTTPILRIADLATEARLHRRTVLKWVAELVESGEITVMDGGRGKKARYTLVHLTGARPLVTAPLPLRADLRTVPPRRLDEATLDLFDAPAVVDSDQTAIKRVVIDHTLAGNVWRSITRWLLNVWRSITRWPKRVVIDHTFAPPLDVDDARARDVHTLKEVHTPAAPQDGPPERAAPAPRRHPWHAWCGRVVCVPQDLHDDWRRKGHEAAWLFAFYARREAAIAVDEKILVNDFTFWRTAFKAELARVTPKSRAPGLGPPGFDTPCPHQPTCDDPAACIDRTMAEWQPKKEQSG